ncbi:nucleotidyltransferase family protein [Sphingomonas adhaesiva]|uniref:nucleotidyltransferase family protein n=1 Tax=Sphingomonas adhaesiva TaxID=28212 RepID=UPI002FF5076C
MLARLLRTPALAETLAPHQWTGVLSAARAEQLLGALAYRLTGMDLPAAATTILNDARALALEARRGALWEAEVVRRALAPLDVPLLLLKGTAFAAAGLSAGQGRMIGDLDLLVPRDALEAVEAALLAAGWEWAKAERYDQLYYRRWMHELPPLIHRDRDRALDVHHTILPPTARITPDAAAIVAAAVPLGNGLSVPCAEDMIVHAALHLLADGDLSGGLRNLWDIDRLLHDHATPDFWRSLAARAAMHGATVPVARALRLAAALFGTAVPDARARRGDAWFVRRLLARDGWGRETRPMTRLAFYLRSHWIRMPAPLLARHLAVKTWMRVAPARS